MPTLSNEIINAAIYGFEEQRRKLDQQMAGLRAMLPGARTTTSETAAPRRKMSAATRTAMAEGQRKRWAAAKGAAPEAPKTTKKPKRKLSAEGRAAIVAALKKR